MSIKSMMKLKSTFNNDLLFYPTQLHTIKPDRKYPHTCHIETVDKDKISRWWHIKNSVLEVQEIYCKAINSKD